MRPPIAQQTTASIPVATNEIRAAVEKGAKWLASVQGADGGRRQDGGAPRITGRTFTPNGSFRNTNNLVKEDDPLIATAFALYVIAR
jgi:hypothetical protein